MKFLMLYITLVLYFINLFSKNKYISYLIIVLLILNLLLWM